MELTFSQFQILLESLDGSDLPQLPLGSQSFASGARLPAADASRAIHDDSSWSYPISDENLYSVGVTDQGERAYEINLTRFMPPGSS